MFVYSFCVFAVLVSMFSFSNSLITKANKNSQQSVASKNNFEKKCVLKFRFARICYFYNFHSSSAIENGCHPTNLIACKIVKVKKLESKCRTYECKVIKNTLTRLFLNQNGSIVNKYF